LRQGKGLRFAVFPRNSAFAVFPQYEKSDVTEYAMNTNSFEIIKLAEKAKENSFYLSPNIYLEQDGKFIFFFTLLPDR